MNQVQDCQLVSAQVGALPIVNRILDRLTLPALLTAALGTGDPRVKLPGAAAVRLVVTNLVLGREPLYALGEWAARYDPALLGLSPAQVGAVNDDRVGRVLEELFYADRASLATAVVLRAIKEFAVDTTQLHNDSTSITLHGNYAGATGTSGDEPTPAVITPGHSKD
ncbi:DUF4277 domain-containing protein, partial [Pengzhenrongella sp.]|uniref:DUF4277 domain-containing protein n=1 Tax=Pengzhenrongella sp. TaxID=2888820 RepID=UPI002F91DE8D